MRNILSSITSLLPWWLSLIFPWLFHAAFLGLSVFILQQQVFAGASGIAALWAVLTTLIVFDIVSDIKLCREAYIRATSEEKAAEEIRAWYAANTTSEDEQA